MSEKAEEAKSRTCDQTENVPDELEEQLDELAETLRDPKRANRTIEDQGEEGSISSENNPDGARSSSP